MERDAKMDAHEDDLDIKLQKISGDLIADFDRSLRPYLRKTSASGDSAVRSRVRTGETERLVSTLLGPFQELPHLLDPYLQKWLSLLTESFLDYLGSRRRAKALSTRSNRLMPLSAGICRIVYTLCKIRGEKVIVRFLNNEVKHLELLLSALEESERAAGPAAEAEWTWEQRYVVLLWLSHLFLAPFDLATISSVDVDPEELPAIPGFQWPARLPGITVRILPLAVKYLASPGRERDAARALLVRISMRRDMQALGVLDALVQWSLSSLRDRSASATRTSYYYIGVLSFLAGILASSADTSDMDGYLESIFVTACASSSEEDGEGGSSLTAITSSALARKMLIKVIRSTVVLALRGQKLLDASRTGMVETVIGYLLESLADNDTPLRLAASKALSVITLRLDADMASEVVEAVLDSLNRNVLWTTTPASTAPAKDLSAVNNLEWHGLMLTLSHLLYRRSPPAENLAAIIQALLMGLSFEQRSTSGSAVGTNVRDASCFGIWALARRYTTKELLAVPARSVSVARHHPAGASVLQILATELVVTASSDPSGNIRRGSSAALQELIGRHPDTVEEGISVVQAVDYHAVALRARAIRQVARDATRLSSQYGEAILAALLSWRGIGAVDPAARRAAAASCGAIAAELAASHPDPVLQLQKSVEAVLLRLKPLQPRQVDERHGLLLALAAALDHVPSMIDPARGGKPPSNASVATMAARVVGALEEIMAECRDKTYRRPELVAEAAACLAVSSFPLLQASLLWPEGEVQVSAASPASLALLSGPDFVSPSGAPYFADAMSALDSAGEPRRSRIHVLVELVGANLDAWMKQSAPENIAITSQAALVFLVSCGPAVREVTAKRWAEAIRLSQAGRTGGHLAALVIAYRAVSAAPSNQTTLIRDAILERWASDGHIDTRVSILQSLTQSEMLRQNAVGFLRLVQDGLDDYTTNARGDVGSHVRLQAVRAATFLWETLDDESPAALRDSVSRLFLKILRLAAEKLDRVRVEAQSALKLALSPIYATEFGQLTFSSSAYFSLLLNLLADDRLRHVFPSVAETGRSAWMQELMAGYVSSADTGNEDLVIASRAALTEFCEASPDNLDAVCTALLHNLGSRQGQDRVIVPTLEIIAFLSRSGIYGQCRDVDYGALCLQVRKTCYKTKNMRKIEACIKVYGVVAATDADVPLRSAELERKRDVGIGEARKRLGALLLNPWPRVRTMVVDELWGLISGVDQERKKPPSSSSSSPSPAEKLKGVDWGAADKGSIKLLVESLDLV